MLRAFFIVVTAIAAFLVATEGRTQGALTADTLMGHWCTDAGAYIFTRDKLIVSFSNGAPQKILRIKEIKVGDGWIEIIWDPRDTKYPNTVFGEFTAKTMVQSANTTGDNGPRREFHRC